VVTKPLARAVTCASAWLAFAVAPSAFAAESLVDSVEWPTYGHDPGGMRYSPLADIDASNVGLLELAWTYHMRPEAGQAVPAAAAVSPDGAAPPVPARPRYGASQATPLVVDGVMFLSTPYRRVVALDAENGREVWAYDVAGPGQPSLRGVEYWPGDAEHGPRVLFGTRDGRLIALDAKSGAPARGFASGGVLDLKTPEVRATPIAESRAQYGLTSPPLVFDNLVITGSATQEFPERGAAGDIRAWDVRSGELVWTFHTVPRPGELGHESWEGDSWRDRSGVNVWGFMTVDVERGMLYAPIAAPAWDRYGGDRAGDNLFSSSVVALDARTGRRLWHFQLVHHDVWDLDTQAPPLLLDVRRRRTTVPAVAIVSKGGYFFLLDRRTGEPLLDVKEQPVPASELPGERAARTQPIPVTAPPFARTEFSLRDVATVTPELEAFCRGFIAEHGMRAGGPYLPIGRTPTIHFPGRLGGANWGGGSYDPVRGLFFVNASNLGHVEQLTPRSDGTLTNAGAATGRFSDRERKLPCQQPPWGTLTAIDVRTGRIAWQSALGVSDQLPAAAARTGRPNIGGSIATAGGVVFIGATDDARFRAFGAETGEELWSTRLRASAHATPITYRGRRGKQYVAIVATGGSFLDSPIESDELAVFALP
jgi:quinoprotein glucose dehydrogenase